MDAFVNWFQQAFSEPFLQLVNMAVTASYVALAVLLARVLLRRAPKRFSYALWGAVGFRLVLPVSFSLPVSFLGLFAPRMSAGGGGTLAQPEYVPIDYAGGGYSQAAGYSPILLAPDVGYQPPPIPPGNSADPMEILVLLCALVWAAGLLVLLGYGVVSYTLLLRRIRTATRLDSARCEAARVRLGLRRAVRVLESDRAATPFVCGFARPRIIVPVGLTDRELDAILTHEMVHIQRLDYLVKPAAFLLLAVYWFNPLLWLCFVLFSKDLEMSCDERALRALGETEKAGYSASLLALAAPRRLLRGSPLAFGETGVKSRIKNALSYKKPALWVIIGAAVLVAALVVFLTANPAAPQGGTAPVSGVKGTEALEEYDFSRVWADSKYYDLTPEQADRLRERFHTNEWRKVSEGGAAAKYASISYSFVFSTAKSGMPDDTIRLECIEGDRARFTLSRAGMEESVWTARGGIFDEVEAYLLETLPHPLAGLKFTSYRVEFPAVDAQADGTMASAASAELIRALCPVFWEDTPSRDDAELAGFINAGPRGFENWGPLVLQTSSGEQLMLRPGGSRGYAQLLEANGEHAYSVSNQRYAAALALLREQINREQGGSDPLKGITIEQFWSWDITGESAALPIDMAQAEQLKNAMRTEEWVCLPGLADPEWGSGCVLAPADRFPRLTMTGNCVFLRTEADGSQTAWCAPSETYTRVSDTLLAIQGSGPIGGVVFTKASWNGTEYDLIPERAGNILGAPPESAYWEEIPGGYRGSFDPSAAKDKIELTSSAEGPLFTVYPWVEGKTLVRVIPEPLRAQWNGVDYWAAESVGSNLMRAFQSIRYGDREAALLVETIPEMTRLSAGYVQRVELSEPNAVLQKIEEPSYVRRLVEALRAYPRGEQAEPPADEYAAPNYELNVILKDGTVLFYDDYGDRVRVRFSSPEGYSLYDTFYYQADQARGGELLGLAREGALAPVPNPSTEDADS